MTSLRNRLLLYLRRHERVKIGVLLAPTTFWVVAFTLLPILIVLYYSFLTSGLWGMVVHELTLDNYREIIDPLFFKLFLRSFLLAAVTVVLCLAAGYPLAYWIAFYGGRYKPFLVFLVILPFWSSYLVRLYAWMTILSDHGIINSGLQLIGLISEPIPLLHNEFAVVVGLTYTYLPMMTLPLYASLERLDRRLLDAAADLGAAPATQFARVTLPLTRGGIISGSVLVFVPAIGEFLVPDLLGGAKVMMIGKFITMKFVGLRDWPLGSAFSLLLMVLVLLVLVPYLRAGGSPKAFEEQL